MKTIEQIIKDKAEIRVNAINKLIEAAAKKGEETNRMFHMLDHDYNHAPFTTNRAQLLEIGITIPPLERVPLSSLPDILRIAIAGLAKYQIFLLHTNHLTDAEFYEMLCKIIDEKVREVVTGSSDVHEFIDIVGGNWEIKEKFYGKNLEDILECSHLWKSNRDESLPRPVMIKMEIDHDNDD